MRWNEYECSLAGCTTRVKARAMCCLHYRRWMQYGDPRKVPDPKWGKSIKNVPVVCFADEQERSAA